MPQKKHVATYATGTRVAIRDEEWMVRSVHPTITGGQALRVIGTTELVRGKTATFLDELDKVRVLDPVETALCQDTSKQYRKSRLYIESLLRQSPPTRTEGLVIGHRGAMREAAYQRVPAAQALRQTRARILIADGVGLGKTIEVGMLLSELIRRGRGRRILVVALRSVLEQFQHELWARFTIPLVRLDSVGIARVARNIPANVNPFHYYDRVTISIDTLKKDQKYRRYLKDCHWDAIVIDECQHVAERSRRGGQSSMRARLAKLLAETCDSLILTSATPHDGRPESFASLMNLLDPTAIQNPSSFSVKDVENLFVRRFKRNIEAEVQASFQTRQDHPEVVLATPGEDALLTALRAAEFKTIRGGGALFATLLRKAAYSSIEALCETLAERQKNRNVVADTPEAAHDRGLLERLVATANKAKKTTTAKFGKLVEILKQAKLSTGATDNRVVIFSERVATVKMLLDKLPKALGLPATAVATFTGSTDDTRQQDLVKSFGSRDSDLRVLLCTDAAAEGINLHYYCHRLIHFDIPWSLITLEQRNGRVDRYGQTREPQLHYLLVKPQDKSLMGDFHVLDRLVTKEKEAHKNLGDVQSLLQLHTAAAEEEHILRGVAAGKKAEEIIPEIGQKPAKLRPAETAEKPANAATPEVAEVPEEIDEEAYLALFEPMDENWAEQLTTQSSPPAEVCELPTLYGGDDRSFVEDALIELATAEGSDVVPARRHDEAEGLEITATADLRRRFDLLPPELRTQEGGTYKLSTNREFLMEQFQRARERQDAWIDWHLLWDLHPVCEWVTDRLVAHMDEHAAPVVRVRQGLEDGHVCFLVQGVLSNKRHDPQVCAWFGLQVPLGATKPVDVVVLSFANLKTQLGLTQKLSNDGQPVECASILPLRAVAIAAAVDHMQSVRGERGEQLAIEVRAEARRLKAWAGKQNLYLQAKRARTRNPARIRQFDAELERVRARVESREKWYEDVLTTADQPYLRIAAVFVPRSHPAGS